MDGLASYQIIAPWRKLNLNDIDGENRALQPLLKLFLLLKSFCLLSFFGRSFSECLTATPPIQINEFLLFSSFDDSFEIFLNLRPKLSLGNNKDPYEGDQNYLISI